MAAKDTKVRYGKRLRNGLLAAEENIRKYFIYYTLLSIIIAIPVGYYLSSFNLKNQAFFSDMLIVFAIMIIYPSMIQLRTEGEHIKKAFKSWKVILIAMIYIFALAPIMALFMSPYLGSGIGAGFFITNMVPASSSALGYVLIVEGSIEMAAAIVIVSLSAAVFLIPLFASLYSTVAVKIPLMPIVSSIIYLMVIPIILGQITRYILYKKKGEAFINKDIRPYLTLLTMFTMFLMIFIMVEDEAMELITHPLTVGLLLLFQLAIMLVVLFISIVVSMRMKLSYEEHQAVAFMSMTKNLNISSAIAIFSGIPGALIPPALIRLVQPVVSVVYVHFDKAMKRILPVKETPLQKKLEKEKEKKEKEPKEYVGEED